MKKSRKQRSGKQKRQTTAEVTAERHTAAQRKKKTNFTRRALIALPVVAIAGYFTATQVQAIMSESDLSKINSGKPSIVQIHDPQCSMCRTLQNQTRKALKAYDDDTFEYLVANIRSEDGLAFSSKYGVSHVTLLLFDAKGEMVEIVKGPTDMDTLRRAFDAHLKKQT